MIELEGADRARAVQDCGRSAPSTSAILLSQVFQGVAMVMIITESVNKLLPTMVMIITHSL